MKNIDLYGFDISTMALPETVREIADRVEAGKRTAVFTPNPEMLERAIRDRNFASLLRDADILTPDGVGVCLAARLLCGERLSRVCGVELGRELLRSAERRGWGVFFLGGKKGVPERAADKIRREFPRLRIVGLRHGYFDSAEDVFDEISRASPDLLFVCLGSPKQERWIAESLPRLPHPCAALGLGGSLDVYAGVAHRAPRAFRFFGLEWLWRILLDPSRARRALPLFEFALRVLCDAVCVRLYTVQRAQSKRDKSSVRVKK